MKARTLSEIQREHGLGYAAAMRIQAAERASLTPSGLAYAHAEAALEVYQDCPRGLFWWKDSFVEVVARALEGHACELQAALDREKAWATHPIACCGCALCEK